MDKKCLGCGIELQDENVLNEGYVASLEHDYCERCFRLKHYGEYIPVTRSNEEYQSIVEEIKKTHDLVVYVSDVLNLEDNLKDIRLSFPNKMILVLNKRDVLPKSIKDEKIINYLKEKDLGFDDVILISSNKNYNLDHLMSRIKYYQTTKNVYFIGHANAGKSSLINKLIELYSDNEGDLTISPAPGTTLGAISIDINDYLTVIDTPGVLESENLASYVEKDIMKSLSPKKEIKVRNFQIRKGQSLVIPGILRIDYLDGEKNAFAFYISNDLKVKKHFNIKHDELKEFYREEYNNKFDSDLVISGLGFIKIRDMGKIALYLNKDVKRYFRDSII